jgi:hypothetical protein
MQSPRSTRSLNAATFLSAALCAAPASAATISFFQPNDGGTRVGYLGLYNRGTSSATITISGKDDTGAAAKVTVTVPPGAAWFQVRRWNKALAVRPRSVAS